MESNTDQSSEFQTGLSLFDLPGSNGLIYVDTHAQYDAEPSIRVGVEQALHHEADAVYFRYLKNRASVSQFYIYDLTNKPLIESNIGEIQRKIWSSGAVLIAFIFTNTTVKIIDCTKPPTIGINGRLQPVYLERFSIEETLLITAEANKRLLRFKSSLFDNGTFWEQEENKHLFNFNNSAYEKLISGLRQVKKEFLTKSTLAPRVSQRLLVQSILIKYLEEREDREGNKVFPPFYFEKYNGSKDFCQVLRNGHILQLFDDLNSADRFSGKIFEWSEADDRVSLENQDVSELADFLDANVEVSKQYVIWRLYSFNFLPVELISNIYEEFLGNKSEGAVYTPPHLVHFLIDECMPVNAPKENFKIVDPSCGSGVFLVAAYKRTVQWWRLQNNWSKPTLAVLKQLLKENIYGVDISHEAVQLAVFSLSIALCDMLTPAQIWDDLKFDDLSQENLVTGDFFAWKKNNQIGFNLVIGNPPFKEALTTSASQEIEKERIRKKLPKTPQNQIALLFLEQAGDLLTSDGLLCLLMPAGPILYHNNLEYKKHLFESIHVLQVADFTSLRRVLFPNATIAVAAIFANKQATQDDILHLTIRRTKLTKEKIFFEIDEYDFHYIKRDLVTVDNDVWKSNLLGGGRLHQLISRLAKLRRFDKYLSEKESGAGWVIGEGYIVSTDKTLGPEDLERKYKKADWITNRPMVDSNQFNEHGIQSTTIEKEVYFSATREKNKGIFSPPHILIKKNIGLANIPIAFRDDYLTFRNDIIGIHSPQLDKEELRAIESNFRLHNDTYRFFITSTSEYSGIGRPVSVILKKDLLNLPYPEEFGDLSLSESEKIVRDDVVNYMENFLRYGEKSIVLENVSIRHLMMYSKTVCGVLNSVYAKGSLKFRQWDCFKSQSYICNSFVYSETGKEIELIENHLSEEHLNELIRHHVGNNLYVNRIIKIYKENIIYLIKPNQIRYWLGSIALIDADKIFSDLLDAGY